MNIRFELLSCGSPKEIWIEKSPFYGDEITPGKVGKKQLQLSSLFPMHHSLGLRGLGKTLYDIVSGDPPFEQQWEDFRSMFAEYVLSLLPTKDDPLDFLETNRHTMLLNPERVSIRELASGYYRLGHRNEAISVVREYIDAAHEELRRLRDAYTPERYERYCLPRWNYALTLAQELLDTLQDRGIDASVLDQMVRRENDNAEFCKTFFRIK